MLDFVKISTRIVKNRTEVYPKFIVGEKSKDLMIRGSDFYAIWDDAKQKWSTDESDAIKLIDAETKRYLEERREDGDRNYYPLYLWDSDSGLIDKWHKYCQKQCRDNFHSLDEHLIFSNTEIKKTNYASKQLDYALEPGDISAYEDLVDILYDKEERHKFEWCIGSIINGDSRRIQKFCVFYGSGGTGKSTILNIIQMLFKGYYCTFRSSALANSNSTFALEPFKENPLVAIEHDGDLSHIEDNSRLNSLISHEEMSVNEKFKSLYSQRFKSFLFMGTNKPVRITDSRSGLIRRLIDIQPTGKTLPIKQYTDDMARVKFELGAIAHHCLQVYEDNPEFYDGYVPIRMIGASNDTYNFIMENMDILSTPDGISLSTIWELYKEWSTDANVRYAVSKRVIKEEMKNYYASFEEMHTTEDGKHIYSWFSGFRMPGYKAKLNEKTGRKERYYPQLVYQHSLLDIELADCPAQYATKMGTPMRPWENCRQTLKDLDTKKLHYVKVPENLIVIDLDIQDANGNKLLNKNLDAAAKFPPTYTEVSKSGNGVHLHYYYDGDVSKLKHDYAPHIEVKTFPGNASLRRAVILCNDIPIAHLSTGLPLKEEDENVVNFDSIKNEKAIITLIEDCIAKKHHGATKPEVMFIKKILDDAYASGIPYDVTNMRKRIQNFAGSSTHNASYCLALCQQMKYMSENPSDDVAAKDDRIIFFDCEVFPNLFVVNWKYPGEDQQVIRMINPSPDDVAQLCKAKLIGFNCRRYDNHILYGRMQGYTNEMLFNLSQDIVVRKEGFFREAYNLSYTDIYDFSSEKKSLKKFEIELGIHHQELGLPWDQPVPESKWTLVAEYCDNDVRATEAVWNARQGDFKAREILAALAGGTVNDTTNQLTGKIIFRGDKNPQQYFNYRNLGEKTPKTFDYKEAAAVAEDILKEVISADTDTKGEADLYQIVDELVNVFHIDKPMPYFPGYSFKAGVSTYRGEETGEGGYVYAAPGMYGWTTTEDVASMHPSSAEDENLFGKYTRRFSDLKLARLYIKHKDYESAKQLFDGKLAPYLDDPDLAKQLSAALKIAINSVYGLTSAHFDNPFRDKRNIDNIVAKRGALFMIDLKNEVLKRGFEVIHIKTDSIKVADPTPEILWFIYIFGKLYGYTFEIEDEWDRICLVNDAVFIGKTKKGEWKAVGAQFQHPYIFKSLFTHEDITFDDLCETKEVKSALYLKYKDGEYEFIGRVGQFCPIKPGCGGGELFWSKDREHYNAATGTKGYFWLDSEVVRALHKEDDIDISYFENLKNKAADSLVAYGDSTWFLSDDPYIQPDFVEENGWVHPVHSEETAYVA